MRVPFLDLKVQYNTLRPEILAVVERVLDSTHYIMGPEIQKFEQAFAEAHGAPFAITTNNGTSALHLALWAMGVQRGDEVILPVNTFIATAEAVLLTGATPIFVDHDEFFQIDVDQVESRITRRAKAIIPVHLYGQIGAMDALKKLADRHGLMILEDAAQAHLSTYHDKPVGSWGSAAGFSFYPGKNLGAYGEGGAVITHDAALAAKMRILRDHGSASKYNHELAGHNYRLEALQGAILGVKLPHLAKWTTARRAHAAHYCELLSNCKQISLPKERTGAKGVYHLFVILANDRDGLKEHLERAEIGTGLHYPVPLHRQPCFHNLGYKEGAFPHAERAARRLLSLPMFPELQNDQIEFVAQTIFEFYNKA